MNNNDFILNRKGASFYLYFAPIFLLIYPFIQNEFFHGFFTISNKNSILIYSAISIVLFYVGFLLIQFTLKVTESHLVINNVSSVAYEHIQKCYLGKFSFIETFEDRDNLPLNPFKDKSLESFFKERDEKAFPSGAFLAIQTKGNLFFIKAEYFNEESFLKVIDVLQKKNIFIEVEHGLLTEKAV